MYQTLELLKKQTHLKPDKLIYEDQNHDYEGLFFHSIDTSYRSRLAKKTEKKLGYFVVFWEKGHSGKNQPYTYETAPDYTLVWIIDGDKQGYFCFPKEILREKNILRTINQTGKMAIRVYPDWVTNLNPTAKKSQQWQTNFFHLFTQAN